MELREPIAAEIKTKERAPIIDLSALLKRGVVSDSILRIMTNEIEKQITIPIPFNSPDKLYSDLLHLWENSKPNPFPSSLLLFFNLLVPLF